MHALNNASFAPQGLNSLPMPRKPRSLADQPAPPQPNAVGDKNVKPKPAEIELVRPETENQFAHLANQLVKLTDDDSKNNAASNPQVDSQPAKGEELREAFSSFVGETFYAQMIKSMRSTVGEPAYFHGGRAEEVFQSQLDQMLAEAMTESTADQLAGPMFDLFQMNLQQRWSADRPPQANIRQAQAAQAQTAQDQTVMAGAATRANATTLPKTTQPAR